MPVIQLLHYVDSTVQYSLTVFYRASEKTRGVRNGASGALEKGGPEVIFQKKIQINIIKFNKYSNVLSLSEICYWKDVLATIQLQSRQLDATRYQMKTFFNFFLEYSELSSSFYY